MAGIITPENVTRYVHPSSACISIQAPSNSSARRCSVEPTTCLGQAAFDPIDAEPATITNLDASVGLAYVSGMVTQTNTKTDEVVRLPFVNSDMRFMQACSVARTGKFTEAFARIVGKQETENLPP